jgi:hypothetical protein
MLFRRMLAAIVAGLAASATLLPIGSWAQQSEMAITCTNPVSGARWQMTIDYRRSTVDSHPAQISDDEISWRDPNDGGNYTFDRESGDLTAAIASSTGGWLRHSRCSLEKPR